MPHVFLTAADVAAASAESAGRDAAIRAERERIARVRAEREAAA